jgi:nitrate reductase gamma subunit
MALYSLFEIFGAVLLCIGFAILFLSLNGFFAQTEAKTDFVNLFYGFLGGCLMAIGSLTHILARKYQEAE